MQRAIVIATVTLLISEGVAAGQPVFQPFADLPGGGILSFARAISADGSTIVGYSGAATGVRATAWGRDGAVLRTFEPTNPTWASVATAVSADGSVVGGHSSSRFDSIGPGSRPFVWRSSRLQVVGPEDGFEPNGIAAFTPGGEIAVGIGSIEGTGGYAAYRYPLTGFDRPEPLDHLDNEAAFLFSGATCISADGLLVGGYSWSSQSGREAFLWTPTEGTFPARLRTGRFMQTISAMSPSGGTIVGAAFESGRETAYRWVEGEGGQLIGRLPGALESTATGASDDGSVIVGRSGGAAFIWTEDAGLQDLRAYLVSLDPSIDLSGWLLQGATGISADGAVISGYGLDADGNTRGWVVTVPSPWTSPALLIGVAAVRRRRAGLIHRR